MLRPVLNNRWVVLKANINADYSVYVNGVEQPHEQNKLFVFHAPCSFNGTLDVCIKVHSGFIEFNQHDAISLYPVKHNNKIKTLLYPQYRWVKWYQWDNKTTTVTDTLNYQHPIPNGPCFWTYTGTSDKDILEYNRPDFTAHYNYEPVDLTVSRKVRAQNLLNNKYWYGTAK